MFSDLTNIGDIEAERLMRPGVENTYGFLGKDEDLQARITEDARCMQEHKLSYVDVAKRIREVFASRESDWNGHPIICKKFIASMKCPWNDYLASDPFSMTLEVREIILFHRDKIDEALQIIKQFDPEAQSVPLESYKQLAEQNIAMILSDLHPHLLAVHQFLQGTQTPYRIHPERVREYLGPDL